MGKDILAEMFTTGKRAGEVMAEKGLEQINDPEKIAARRARDHGGESQSRWSNTAAARRPRSDGSWAR